jgi:anti-sigma regulatory factor (Ser/Thr protein kinase)
MLNMEIVRLIDSRLSVRIQIAPPFFISAFEGAADDTSQATLREWTQRMAEEPEPIVVLEMGSLDELTGAAASSLSRGLREAQRLEKGVRLVRCRRANFDRLCDAGLRGEVWHCGSLAHATEGMLGGAETATGLHFRAEPAALGRLEIMLESFARQLRLPPETSEALRAACLEATTNALRHGSPRGFQDRVSLIFHRLRGQLVIEVQDRGPGFAPAAAGDGAALMRRLMDEVEYLPNPIGLLTRLTMALPASGERV